MMPVKVGVEEKTDEDPEKIVITGENGGVTMLSEKEETFNNSAKIVWHDDNQHWGLYFYIFKSNRFQNTTKSFVFA